MRQWLTGVVALGLLITATILGIQKFPTAGRGHSQSPAKSDAGATAIQRRASSPGLAVQNRPILPRLSRLPSVELSDDTVAARFPAFQHAPFESSGFNPLSLPFRYKDPNHVGDVSEANAFAFLMGYALDWAPGNYSARHTYFVFAESARELAPLIRGYNHQVISQQIGFWSATHAVGGVLRRTAAGCSGTLEVYASDGQLEFSKDYADPRPYFDLLGDMSVDAIAHFGPPPSKELAALLHQPRCEHTESVVRLGLAAFQPRQGPRAMRLLAEAIRDDPMFSEVRGWRANQQYWVDGDRSAAAQEWGRALHYRPVPDALGWFDPVWCPDPKLNAEYPSWVDRTEQLAGADAPLTLYQRLRDATQAGRFDADLYRRALAVAAQYPSDRNLIEELATTLTAANAGPVDAELAASLWADAIACRFLDGAGDHHREWQMLGNAAALTGHADLALAALEKCGAPDRDRLLCDRIQLMCSVGRFADAVAFYRANTTASEDPVENGMHATLQDLWRIEAAQWASVAAATVGDAKSLADLRRQFAIPFKWFDFATVLTAYTDAIAGRTVARAFLSVHRPKDGDFTDRQAWLVMAAQVDQAIGFENQRSETWDALNEVPSDRLCWALYDQYERQRPTADHGPGFYEVLAWLHPDDPWVSQVVADAGKRGVNHTTPAPDASAAVVKALADVSPDELPSTLVTRGFAARRRVVSDARPWVVAAAVHRLLASGQPVAAHDLALRFRHLAVDLCDNNVGAFASMLVARTPAK